MNKKIVLGLIAVIIAICALASEAIYLSVPNQTLQAPTGELDFTVSGASDCLRFLNDSVPTIYVPFTIAAQENWQLTINCTKMPGGSNGYTDVYVYNGYWDGGSNYTCKASDIYPILSDLQSTGQQIRLGSPFTSIYGLTGSGQRSCTVFFVLPPGGQATFHVTLKQA